MRNNEVKITLTSFFNGWTFALFLVVLLVFAIHSASLGNVVAMVVLSVVTTATLIAVGAGIVILAVRIMAEKEQKAFRDNTAENLAILKQVQGIQNQQNTQLLRQVNTLSRLPEDEEPHRLLIEDGIFAELED